MRLLINGKQSLLKLQATSPKDSSKSSLFWTFKRSKPSWKQGACSVIMPSRKIFLDFAAGKVTADLDCVHMLTYNARVWRSLLAMWSYNELDLTNHSAILNVAFSLYIIYYFHYILYIITYQGEKLTFGCTCQPGGQIVPARIHCHSPSYTTPLPIKQS